MVLKCRWCRIHFQNAEELRNHLKLDIEEHLYYCKKCKFSFMTFRALKEHFAKSSKHRDEDPNEDIIDVNSYCRNCQRQFENSEELANHFSKAHNSALHCEICEIWFPRKQQLDDHNSSPVHNERNIPCPHCSKLLKTTSGVAHHLEFKCLRKITDTVVKWDVDNLITGSANQVIANTNRIREVNSDDEEDDILVMRKKEGILQILDILVTKDAWNSVMQAYVCPVADCGRRFARVGDINQHLRSQFHRNDPDTFRCPKCEGHFSVVSALIQHLESGSCGLSEIKMVTDIYNGLHDMFRKLLKF